MCVLLAAFSFCGAAVANGLTPQRLQFVSAYVGEARGNASEAARIAGYRFPRQEGHRLLTNADISDAIQIWRDEVKTIGIANLEYRLSKLDELERLHWDVIDDRRSAYATDAEVIGGRTGLIGKQFKQVGGGECGELVAESVYDAALVKGIQSVYADAAKELGQRVEKVNVSGSLKREYVLVRPGESIPDAEDDS